jgi:hypothetical protein
LLEANGDTPMLRVGTAPPRPHRKGAKRWLRPGVLVALAVLGVLAAGVYYVFPHPLAWREEVALPDGGSVSVTWRVWFVAGEPGHMMVGRQQLTFAHPTTGRPVVWEDPGTIGSRLHTILLAVDAGRLFLVGLAATGPDYDGFDCPTPPYIVLRYDAAAWVRVPFGDLPTRFAQANLLTYPGDDVLRGAKYALTATQVAAHFARVGQFADTAHFARIDRRIRNPVGMGCIRPDRVYGKGSYKKWTRMGNWLNLPQEEALQLLEKGGRP